MGQGLYALALFLGPQVSEDNLGPQVSEDNPSAEAPRPLALGAYFSP